MGMGRAPVPLLCLPQILDSALRNTCLSLGSHLQVAYRGLKMQFFKYCLRLDTRVPASLPPLQDASSARSGPPLSPLAGHGLWAAGMGSAAGVWHARD